MPDNASYMAIAYIAAAAVLVGYIASLVSRSRAMARRAASLDGGRSA